MSLLHAVYKNCQRRVVSDGVGFVESEVLTVLLVCREACRGFGGCSEFDLLCSEPTLVASNGT